ncbi:hypothetical protein [Brevundimonas naejangsanensis]|nr:hypothetical protein [Brevundimonas naejangsanensis]
MAGILTTATPAHAEWRKAESDRFIVYSDVGERQLRNFVQDLESYDRVLRFRMGLPGDVAQALLSQERNAEAIALLEPLVNHPHGSTAAARALLARARGKETPAEDAGEATADEADEEV